MSQSLSTTSRSTTPASCRKAQKRQAQAEEKLRQKLEEAEEKKRTSGVRIQALSATHESSDDEDEEVEQTEEISTDLRLPSKSLPLEHGRRRHRLLR